MKKLMLLAFIIILNNCLYAKSESSDPTVTLLTNPTEFNLITNRYNSINVGNNSSPAATDLDNDGLIDLLIGEISGNLNHYEQNSENSTSFTLVTDTFNGIDVGSYSASSFADLDGDGLLDMLIGELSGNINHYEQDSINATTFTLITETFNGIDVGDRSSPSFTDLDNDGLLDILVAEYTGNINHYEQDSINATTFTLITSSFNGIDVGYYSTLSFTDLENDGLLDMLIGENNGNLNHYKQVAENSYTFTPVTADFDKIKLLGDSAPLFVDINDNGLIDMLVGEGLGYLSYYEQAGCDSIDFGGVITSKSVNGNYFLKAENLTADLDISCPEEGFTVSLSESSGFSHNLSLTPVNGFIADTVFVKFQPVLEQEYSGVITHSSINMAEKHISLTGYCAVTDGFPGTSLDFDGTDDRVIIHHSSSLDILDEITVEMWVRNGDMAEDRDILRKGSIVLLNWDEAYDSYSGKGYRVNIPGPDTGWWEFGYDISDNEWNHVAWSLSSTGELKAYVNGINVRSGNFTPGISTNTDDLIIAPDTAGQPFKGELDEMRIWNKVRTEQEIREYLNIPLAGTETGLVSYWQFNQSSDTTAYDFVSLNNGTMTNMDQTVRTYSTVPFGHGHSDSQTETSGTVNFTDTDVSMDFTVENGAEITVSRIDTTANMNPRIPITVYDAQYWVINRFGTGEFSTDVIFRVSEGLSLEQESSPLGVGLYTRPSNSDEDWTFLKSAGSVDAEENTATFNGISSFGQFMIGKILNPEISVADSLKFGKVLEGDSLKLNLNISNTGADTLFISDITIDKDFFSSDTVEMTLPPLSDQNIVIKLTPRRTGVLISKLKILSNDPDEPEIYVSLEGTGMHPVIAVIDIPLDFSLKSAAFNSITFGHYYYPAFIDLDGDGLLDMLLGEYYGDMMHYEQESTNSVSFIQRTETFNGIDVGYEAAPAFTDLDGDELLDMLIGESTGHINHYEQVSQNSTVFSLITETFNGIDVGYKAKPAITDLDGDGLLDLVIGEDTGNIYHYEQDELNSTSFTLVTGSFNNINVGLGSSPSFTDIDGDGMIDMFIGNYNGNILHYEQDSMNSVFFSLVTNLFKGIDVGNLAAPCFTDLDDDGLLDLMIGSNFYNLKHYEQVGMNGFDFGEVPLGEASIKKYFIKATDLADDLDICVNEGFLISLNEQTDYQQGLTMPLVNNSVSDTLFVRFEPVTAVEYSDSISHTSTDLKDLYFPVTGRGIIGVPDNLTTTVIGSDFHITWDEVTGASSYTVYSSDNPDGPFIEVATAPVGETVVIPTGESKKFFFVIAADGAKFPVGKKEKVLKSSTGR